MKKLLTILVLIMLIISFFQITSMYALYKEEIEGEYSTLLGVWAIKVNGTDISSGGQNLTFTISDDQLQYVESSYIQAGKIAPNGQAYFDIVIDPSDVYTDSNGTEQTVYNDVSIIYKIDVGATATGSNAEIDANTGNVITPASTANIQLVSAENYFGQGTNGQTNKTTNTTDFTDGNSYTSVIPINMITQGYKNYVRLYFQWVNDESKNATDSTLASSEITTEIENEGVTETVTESATISVPLQINLKQYTGEVIGNAAT